MLMDSAHPSTDGRGAPPRPDQGVLPVDLGPLPWLARTIERVLPHRAAFLFVDRILELEPERRVVGTRTWSEHDAVLGHPDGGRQVPAPYLTECMAQVGAVLILARPENLGRIIYFMGIERGRFRHPVRAGDTLYVVAEVRRMRSRMGTL